eukprot:1903031-Rhodomonas_salina.2
MECSNRAKEHRVSCCISVTHSCSLSACAWQLLGGACAGICVAAYRPERVRGGQKLGLGGESRRRSEQDEDGFPKVQEKWIDSCRLREGEGGRERNCEREKEGGT